MARWTVADVDTHLPGLNDAQKGAWVRIANGALEHCAPGDDCEGKAIRIANASAKTIGEANVGLLESVIAAVQTILPRTRGEATQIEEVVQLVERQLGADGMVRIKLIKPGWGSSGFYDEKVLRRDGAKVWPKGTKMYANHPTVSEERERPERKIEDIAAVFQEDPVWENDARHGPGLYTKAKVVDTWKPQIEALIGTIDTSIRASGKGIDGEREGRKGTIVEELTKGYSVDFVTNGGAGGKLIGLNESARPRQQEEDIMADEKELTEARTKLAEATRERDEWKTTAKRLQEAVLVGQAATRAQTKLKEIAIPDSTKARIVATVSANPPTKDDKLDEAALDAKIIEAAQVEAKYLKDLGVGTITGINGGGGGDEGDATKIEAELAGVFQSALGLSEAEAKIAARGRN